MRAGRERPSMRLCETKGCPVKREDCAHGDPGRDGVQKPAGEGLLLPLTCEFM